MEFIQFHPTALHPTEDPAFLISEALRGEGAVLRRIDGSAFMDWHHPLGSLAPRDIVARAIHRELVETGDAHVVLDVSGIPDGVLESRFPGAVEGCRARGIEPGSEGIPVVPAAHYLCGGIRTDTWGRSSLEGLLAAGEVACTGLHGANRLASNSLLEAVVVAHRAAEVARGSLEAQGRWGAGAAAPDPGAAEVDRTDAPEVAGRRGAAPDAAAGIAARSTADADPDRAARATGEEIRDLMWTHAGIVRTSERLAEARVRLEAALLTLPEAAAACTPSGVEARNIAETALLVVRSAEARRESRGLHYMLDHPWRDNERHLADTVLVRGEEAT
jgi:L-aspartate oxidase